MLVWLWLLFPLSFVDEGVLRKNFAILEVFSRSILRGPKFLSSTGGEGASLAETLLKSGNMPASAAGFVVEGG
jgi:hypothetical protein